MARPFLSLKNASFRLGERLVFENTNWSLNYGEQWAVFGHNGSGKSLLAAAIRGRLPLVNGELNYHFPPVAGLSPEESIAHVSFEDRKLDQHGAVVQSRWQSLEEEHSILVGDFLSYEHVLAINPYEVTSPHSRLRPQFERRRKRAVRLLKIEAFLGRPLLSLSNGESQRVQLARALCHPMRLLVLDDPFTGLDVVTRRHFQTALQHLMAGPLRVLILTTRLEDLPRGVTHIVSLKHCRVTVVGRRSMLLSRARLPFPDRNSRNPISAVRSSIPDRHRSPVPTRSSPLVLLRNITVRYGETSILENLNWTIREGESWVLAGPNGSGKTTILSLILGDHPQAYANDIAVFGKHRGNGESIWDVKRDIGWVSPELHLHFATEIPCLEVVLSGLYDSIGLFRAATRRQVAAARRWLRLFGLSSLASAPLSSVSLGLQRMVLLARALVKKPKLLILDEPCQGLDSARRTRFIRTVDKLIRSKASTVIYVTHRADEVPSSIRRVLRLPSRTERM